MLAIIQSRMSSKRLPGKALMLLDGRPLIARVVDRVKEASMVSRIIVATSNSVDDNQIALFCDAHGIECFRGSLNDVASRLSEAAMFAKVDCFVRINGDSPLIDPDIINTGIVIYNSGNYDLVTNVQIRTFPKGQSVEVIQVASFLEMQAKLEAAYDMEHVTTAYYRNSSDYKIFNFESANISDSDIQLSVDDLGDFRDITNILRSIDGVSANYQSLIDAYRLLKSG
jgi:spore coat polysaccharide biosynthesis protein SpsF